MTIDSKFGTGDRAGQQAAAASDSLSAGLTRRHFGGLVAGTVAAGSVAAPALAQAKGKVVVIGGGAGGATAAKYIKKDSPDLDVTLITASDQFTTCFFSNLYLAGFRSLRSITHSYDQLISNYGIKLVVDTATKVDTDRRIVTTAKGDSISYDKLVLSPGIDFKYEAIPGYEGEARDLFPHAYMAGIQTYMLKKRLMDMRSGGTFLMTLPPNPYRCPPGPYERASMMALMLRRINPSAKLILIDAKNTFSKQKLFQQLWAKNYGNMLDWVSSDLTSGGIASLDAKNMVATLKNGEKIKFDAANIIPPQKAGAICLAAGVTNESGWCPIDGNTMASTLKEHVYVIGDSSIAGDMPKSGFSANSQAKVAAMAVRAALAKAPLFPARFRNTCWSYVSQHEAIKVGASYKVDENKVIKASSTFISDPSEDPQVRLDTALEANSWYAGITADMFI